MTTQNLKSAESCTINNNEMAYMKVCWHMFDPKYREALFIIAGLPRKEYLPLMHTAWEYMPFEYRRCVMAVLTSWLKAKDYDLSGTGN